ncbi:MAG: response regulator [Phycisphaerales bacterium]
MPPTRAPFHRSLLARSLIVALAAALPVLAVAGWFLAVEVPNDHQCDFTVRCAAEAALAAERVRADALECQRQARGWRLLLVGGRGPNSPPALAVARAWREAAERLSRSLDELAKCEGEHARRVDEWRPLALADAEAAERATDAADEVGSNESEAMFAWLRDLPEQAGAWSIETAEQARRKFADAEEMSRSSRRTMLAIAAAGTLLSVGCSGALALLIGRRARRLADSAMRLGEGDLATPVVRENGGDELSIAMDCLDRLRRMVQAREDDLSRQREEARTLATVAERTDNAAVITDASGRTLWVNDAFGRITGRSLDDVRGLNPVEVLAGPGTDATTLALVRDAFASRRSSSAELELYRKDGQQFWVSLDVQPVSDGAGTLTHFIAVARDISDARRAAALRAGEAHVLEMVARGASMEAILRETIALVEGRVDGVRCSMLLRDGDRLCAAVAPSMPPEFRDAVDGLPIAPDGPPCGRATYAGRRLLVEDIGRDAGSAAVRGLAERCAIRSCWSQPVLSSVGETLGCFAMYGREPRGPTQAELALLEQAARLCGIAIERLQTDERLEHLVTELRDSRDAESRQRRELAARNAELERLRVAAEGANAAKSEFLANMSHEIRTPMTAILGYAELLTDPGLSERERADHATTIRRSGEHLLAIINDILDLSKIEAGQITFEEVRCSPASIVDEVECLMRPRAEAKGISFAVERGRDLDRDILTDPTRVRQILLNLVSNAIKFTERGGVTIRASLGPSTEAGGKWILRIEVADTGIGIPEGLRGALFAPFTQGDASLSRRYGGTGLGLTISRRLARLLGGDVTLESPLGGGSVFVATVRCPRVSDAEALAASQAGVNGTHAANGHLGNGHAGNGPLAPAGAIRVLVVEDGYENQRLLSLMLTKSGAEVEVVGAGRAAIDLVTASSRRFDVILMDMQMPDLDGYAVTRRLREQGIATPIIALTAHAMHGDRERCLDAGCDAYLAKPVDRATLWDACRDWSTRRSKRVAPRRRGE